MRVKAFKSTVSRHRAFTAAVSSPLGLAPKPNGAQPQLAQKWCAITCLLNLYVDRLWVGDVMRNCARGTNHNR
ncbi:hypothetical protein D3C71_2182060 [compost metagenome]